MTGRTEKDDDEVYAKYELSPDARPHQPNVALPDDPNLQAPSGLDKQSEEAPRDSFSQWFQEQVDRESAEINLSGADPNTLVSHSLAADANLDRLCKEVLPGLPEIRAALRQEEDVARFNETVLMTVHLACYWLAVIRETNKIIFERLSKNGTNRNFGFFVLAVTTGNEAMREDTQAQLLRIALSIPVKKRWVHPNEPEVWKELATNVLHDELTKHQDLGVTGVLERMVGNGFAYIYIAFEREFIDEFRRLSRRKEREQQFPEFESEAFGSEAQEIEAGDPEQQRQALIKCVQQLEESPKLNLGPRAFMHQLLVYLKEPSKYLDLDRGHAVREVAQRMGVTVQQARNYRKELSAAAKRDPDIGQVKKELRALRLRFCERDGNEQGDQ